MLKFLMPSHSLTSFEIKNVMKRKANLMMFIQEMIYLK